MNSVFEYQIDLFNSSLCLTVFEINQPIGIPWRQLIIVV
jgi:hypothetical protein